MSEETKQVEKFHHPKGFWLACMGMCSSNYLDIQSKFRNRVKYEK